MRPLGDESYGEELQTAGLGRHKSLFSLLESLGRADLDLERTHVSARLC